MEPALTFESTVKHWAEQRPETIALQQNGRSTTFAALDDLSLRLVSLLRASGVQEGDRIAWLGKNSDLVFMLMIAASRCGVVLVPIGWRLAPAEIEYILQDTGAKLLFAGEGFTDISSKVLAPMETGPQMLEEAAVRTNLPGHEKAEPVYTNSETPVLQLYTSGTTGKPKGAVLSNGNLLSLTHAAREAGAEWAQYGPDDAMLVCMPCSHIGGIGLVVISVANGVRAIIQSEFEPGLVLNGIEAGATHLFLVPAAVQMVIQHPAAASADFSRLRYLMYGAAPIPLELLRETVKTMPNAGLLQLYGMTETSGSISLLPAEDHDPDGNDRMRSAGKAMPGVDLAVLGEDGSELPRGEIGEVAIRSPSTMAGYWRLPEATSEALRGGWMHTGDAAYMDEDGYIYIQDRIKDMIISGGENVYPAEVESAIYGHTAVAEVAVIGIPSERWGEEVKACVVAKPGHEIDADEIIAWTRERLAAFKAPKSIDVIDELPRNASGKILRRELRAPYWKGQDRQVG